MKQSTNKSKNNKKGKKMMFMKRNILIITIIIQQIIITYKKQKIVSKNLNLIKKFRKNLTLKMFPAINESILQN